MSRLPLPDGQNGVICIAERPNGLRLQLTAFGARDRSFFDSFRSAPRRQLTRKPLDHSYAYHLRTSSNLLHCYSIRDLFSTKLAALLLVGQHVVYLLHDDRLSRHM